MIGAGFAQLKRDREGLNERLALESLQQVEKVAAFIRDDLRRVSDDLLFTGQLVQAAGDPHLRHSEIEALLAVVKEYEAVHVYDLNGKLLLEVIDPNGPPEGDLEAGRTVMAQTASVARAMPEGEVEVTMPIPVANGRAVRVFGARLKKSVYPKSNAAIITMLVDTEPLFGKLRLIQPNPMTKILFLGAHGQPARLSDPSLSSIVQAMDTTGLSGLDDFSAVVRRMRAGETDTARIRALEGTRLGLPEYDIVAAFANVGVTGGSNWSFGVLRSTFRLRSTEWFIILRLVPLIAVIALLLVGFGVYIVLEARRAGMMRQRLLLADRLGHLHEKMQKMVDNIPTGVMALSSKGSITMVNKVLREKLATDEPRTLAEAFTRASPGIVQQLEGLVEEAMKSGKVQSLHGQRMSLFGFEGQYSVHAVPLESKFDEARVIFVMEDQTEVGTLAQQLVRAEKLATVGGLAAGIAHEIGTPLGVVRGRAEYILGKLGGEHPQAPGMRVIVEQIDFVSRTIRQLLDFSRIKKVLVHPVHVQAVAKTVHELLRLEADRRKVQLSLEVPDNLRPVAADPDQLQQVLVSLCMNALDATPQGGQVRIFARPEEPHNGDPRRIRVEVIDDGCGISKENRSQVFDPFFTTKKRGQGTGLGLTIAAQIVRNHGGEIELESEVGRGTRVILQWPCARVSENEQRDGNAI